MEFKFTLQQLQTMLDYLITKPYKETYSLIADIQRTVAIQSKDIENKDTKKE